MHLITLDVQYLFTTNNVWALILDEQRWKFVGSTLVNKAGTWKSNSSWARREQKEVTRNGQSVKTFILENVSKAKYMTNLGKLTSDEGKAQTWREVNEDKQGFFILEVFLV